MSLGLLVKLQNSNHLYDATSLFRSIAKNADLRFTRNKLIIIATGRRRSLLFVATLHIASQFFVTYIPDDVNISYNVSIESFHDSLLYGGASSSIEILHFSSHKKFPLIFRQSDNENVEPLIYDLFYSPPEGEELEPVEPGKYFTVLSTELRRIIRELPLFQSDYVCVDVTSSQLKFSVGSKEIVITTESGNCTISRFDETQLQIVLRPMLFFLDLTFKTRRIGFYKTISSGCVMSVPISGVNVQYVIYFPQIETKNI